MEKKIILWVIIFIVNVKISYSQNTNFYERTNIIGKSPIVSEFMRYDELPVSEYTGIPNISVPLYEINAKTLKMPLDITYHAGGIKVIQEASWVGLGWDLMLDAKIVQIIKSGDDMHVFYSNKEFIYPNWFLDYTPGYSRFYIPTDNYLHNCSEPYNEIDYPHPIKTPTKNFGFVISTFGFVPINGAYRHYDYLIADIDDSEPDIFKISINGESLSCILDKNSDKTSEPTIIVLNKKGYSVKHTGGWNGQWEVITPDGNKYYFSTNSVTHNRIGEYNQSRIWFLDKVVTVTGEEINCAYTNVGNFINTYKTNTRTIPISSYPVSFSEKGTGYTPFHPNFTDMGLNHLDYSEISEYQYYLSSIQFPKGSIDFSISDRTDIPGKRKLDKITVYNTNQQKIKEIFFTYNYYQGENNWARKLKLASIKINDENPYVFYYDNQLLPAQNSYATDYWGYYNGNTSNKSLAPNPIRWKNKVPYDVPFAKLTSSYPVVTNNNHSARLQYTKAGILEKIQYPTGSKTTFEYDLNQFSNYWVPDYDSLTNNISKGDGLRIKKVRFNDYFDNCIKEDIYSYFGGKAITPLQMFQFIWYNLLIYSPDIPPQVAMKNLVNHHKILKCSTSGNYADNPLSSFSGIGYDIVTKQTIGIDSTSNGIIKTYYNNTPDKTGVYLIDYGEAPQNNLPAFKDSSKPANGTIKKRIYYDIAGIKKIQETFDYINKESFLYYGVNISNYSFHILLCWDVIHRSYAIKLWDRHLLGYYPVFDFESLLANKTIIQYFDSDSIVKSEQYAYNSNNLLSYQEQTGSKEETLYYGYKYPQDYTENVYRKMVENNIVIPKIQSIMGYYNADTVEKKIIHYTDDYSITKGLILPKREELFHYDVQQPTESTNLITYDKYDSFGNILQCKDANNISITYIWGYSYQYPIAEIKNATYEKVRAALNCTSDNQMEALSAKAEPTSSDWSLINNLRTKLPDAQVTIFKYIPLVGRLSTTDPSGNTVYYEYDESSRLKFIKDYDNNILQRYDYNYRNQ
jgi:YD repeat-containing protein